MQEFYGQNEELELQTIQEVSVDFSRASEVQSRRTSRSQQFQGKKEEDSIILIKDNLKFFPKNSEEYVDLI